MKHFLLSLTVCSTGVLAGCAIETDLADDGELAVAESAVTVTECDRRLDQCLSGPFAWLFAASCHAQYDRCLADADRPSLLRDALAGAAACAEEAAVCQDGAGIVQRAVCGVQSVECVADLLDVTVDVVGTVEGVGECATGTIGCIEDARRVSDLAECGGGLVECTVDRATDVVDDLIPGVVTQTVDTVLACTDELNYCVASAETPAQVAACGQANVRCVSEALGVTLPEIPAEQAVRCTTDATECTLGARSIGGVTGCADELLTCARDVVRPVLNPICLVLPFLCR